MKYVLEHGILSATYSNKSLPISKDSTKGYTPLDLLVSSIVGCSQIVFTQILEKKRISYDSLTIDVQIERAEAGAKQLKKVHIHYTLTGVTATQEAIEKALHLVPKHCTIAQSVKGSIEIEETCSIVNES
ncbi:OsmC family protein [Priestia taiwanensis]|uniref:Osmotically inducible protein C n=1 Tax=Priestia taiwanensis TaxID=1347902 RepID=A0A917AXT2_9BACI|nr:OsmC family protein [Priestia taiwanensis]MBM7364703.1 putative OsmC-like protein [Priestia taiwanensis]GGE78990.1 osmotically inducible protein C [Priestia taiwanensis]